MSDHAFMVRPYPDNEKRLDLFQEKGIVAIGWPGMGNLSGKAAQDIEGILKKVYPDDSNRTRGLSCGTINTFVNEIKVGDYLLIPDDRFIYFAVVESEYIYDASVDNRQGAYPHQRKVVFKGNKFRSDLSKPLRNSIKAQQAVTRLIGHYDEIAALAEGKAFKAKASEINITYPLRPNYTVSFKIPEDTTSEEAERLGDFFKTLYFKK